MMNYSANVTVSLEKVNFMFGVDEQGQKSLASS